MMTIAIADDHQTLIDGISLRLEQEPEIILQFTANNGRELLKKLKQTPVDVVITDIKMPKMDGVSLTRVLKNEHRQIKIIVLSMFDQLEAVRKMIDCKVNGYILKTSPLDQLVIALKTVHKGQDYYDSNLEGFSEFFQQGKSSKTSKLSQTEKEILDLIAEGKTSQDIAEIRDSAVSTVDTHRRNMAHKLELYGKGELLRYAMDKKYKFD